jgi:hypothetical protein
MSPEELAAAADFMTAVAELLDGVKLDSFGDVDRWQNSIDRLAGARVWLRGLASDLTIDAGYPNLPDAPLTGMRRKTAMVRSRLAELKEKP